MTITWPKYLTDNVTRAGTALINKVQYYFDLVQADTNSINDLTDPMRCPAKYLDYLGNDLHAEIGSSDTTRIKRLKCLNAINKAKNKSLWDLDLKLRIEAILGYPVFLFSEASSATLDDAIYWGGQDARDTSWSTFSDIGAGELFVGGIAGIPYTENFLPGFICIDVVTTQTAPTLDKIKLAINQNGGYVGHRIFIGYLTGTVYTVEAEA